jgi:magnesium chelatase subunit H
MMQMDSELDGIMRALDGRYIHPAPGGDVLHNLEVLPTGRNLHGFDPFRIPSQYAVQDGAQQAQRILERHLADTNELPESIALVLWGTDNLKTEGAPIAQVLALLGAQQIRMRQKEKKPLLLQEKREWGRNQPSDYHLLKTD